MSTESDGRMGKKIKCDLTVAVSGHGKSKRVTAWGGSEGHLRLAALMDIEHLTRQGFEGDIIIKGKMNEEIPQRIIGRRYGPDSARIK